MLIIIAFKTSWTTVDGLLKVMTMKNHCDPKFALVRRGDAVVAIELHDS